MPQNRVDDGVKEGTATSELKVLKLQRGRKAAQFTRACNAAETQITCRANEEELRKRLEALNTALDGVLKINDDYAEKVQEVSEIEESEEYATRMTARHASTVKAIEDAIKLKSSGCSASETEGKPMSLAPRRDGSKRRKPQESSGKRTFSGTRRHVPEKMNPADDCSRGLAASELMSESGWLSGPVFLSDDEENWSGQAPPPPPPLADNMEEVKPSILASAVKGCDQPEPGPNKFSSWLKRRRVVAWLKRSTHNAAADMYEYAEAAPHGYARPTGHGLGHDHNLEKFVARTPTGSVYIPSSDTAANTLTPYKSSRSIGSPSKSEVSKTDR
ncbi:hypothetical protein FJT64_015656 [Amphibalanus amphitrite]|uniref:Uncharacterized protein n=1 Tax=Amphibalanus amphitrite TaxID=1232801 RepID=A0A6A4X3Q1_AMPAM|nr:hypothetical protein FJT64_015656 [Amphibalanus amphitrite]